MTSNPRTQTKDYVEFYLQFSYCLRTGEPLITGNGEVMLCFPEVLISNIGPRADYSQ